MDLKSLILPEKTVTFDVPGCPGFTIDITYLSKEELQKLSKKCTRTKFDSRTRQPINEFDDGLFMKLYSSAIVKGWDGFKFKYLSEFLVVNLPSDIDPDEDELEFTEDSAYQLLKNSSIFDTWVSEIVGDLGNFTKSSSKTS